MAETSGRGIVLKKHTEKRLLCASQPPLSSACVGKIDTNFDKRGRRGVRGQRRLRTTLPPAAADPYSPTETPIATQAHQYKAGGGPNEVRDHPARGASLLFTSSSTPNSPENGPFNKSRGGPGVVAAPLIETHVQHIETKAPI